MNNTINTFCRRYIFHPLLPYWKCIWGVYSFLQCMHLILPHTPPLCCCLSGTRLKSIVSCANAKTWSHSNCHARVKHTVPNMPYNTGATHTARCSRRYCIYQLDGASCLIGHTPPKQKPAKSAERRPITSPRSTGIPRVSLVKHPHISLNRQTHNVSVRRKPCEKRFNPHLSYTWARQRPSVNDQSAPAAKRTQSRDVNNFLWGNQVDSHVSYFFTHVQPQKTAVSSFTGMYKNSEHKKETFRKADEHLMHMLHAWWTWNASTYTTQQQVPTLTLFYFARHATHTEQPAQCTAAPLIFKNESKLILATAAEKLLLSEAGTSSDTDDSQNNLDSSTTAFF